VDQGRDPARGGTLEEDLVRWGKVVVIESRGRHSGRPRRAFVGFIEVPDGSLLVAASDEESNWARNLLAEPRCLVERDGVRQEHRATQLGGRDHHAAVAALIMKYGTPAERLGSGPAFRLTPITPATGA
jgi:deazaflavin-dependent oxidoreductase (nitroreductase family)